MDRMRCCECNALIPIRRHKCPKCKSEDIDLAIETFTQLEYLPKHTRLRYRDHHEPNGPVKIIKVSA